MHRRYTYKTWSGTEKSVDADIVEFGPAHVVFKTVGGFIVLAERVEMVNGLKEDPRNG